MAPYSLLKVVPVERAASLSGVLVNDFIGMDDRILIRRLASSLYEYRGSA
jgi:hypothetical protein